MSAVLSQHLHLIWPYLLWDQTDPKKQIGYSSAFVFKQFPEVDVVNEAAKKGYAKILTRLMVSSREIKELTIKYLGSPSLCYYRVFKPAFQPIVFDFSTIHPELLAQCGFPLKLEVLPSAEDKSIATLLKKHLRCSELFGGNNLLTIDYCWTVSPLCVNGKVTVKLDIRKNDKIVMFVSHDKSETVNSHCDFAFNTTPAGGSASLFDYLMDIDEPRLSVGVIAPVYYEQLQEYLGADKFVESPAYGGSVVCDLTHCGMIRFVEPLLNKCRLPSFHPATFTFY